MYSHKASIYNFISEIRKYERRHVLYHYRIKIFICEKKHSFIALPLSQGHVGITNVCWFDRRRLEKKYGGG